MADQLHMFLRYLTGKTRVVASRSHQCQYGPSARQSQQEPSYKSYNSQISIPAGEYQHAKNYIVYVAITAFIRVANLDIAENPRQAFMPYKVLVIIKGKTRQVTRTSENLEERLAAI